VTESAYRKLTWTIDADVLDRFRARVPRSQRSAYAAWALRRQLERDDLDELIGERAETNGPLDQDAVHRYARDLC